jgi:hypothetical protein
MEVYHGIKEAEAEFLYAPHNFLLYTCNGVTCITWKPQTLKDLEELISKGIITQRTLERKGWEIREEILPDCYVKQFQDNTFGGKGKGIIERQVFLMYEYIISKDTSRLTGEDTLRVIDYTEEDWRFGI